MSYTRQTPGESIAAYLNRTRHIHHGLGWSDLMKRLELGAKKTRIAADFGVSRVTLDKWIKTVKGDSDAKSEVSRP